jgi:hypothetical protein
MISNRSKRVPYCVVINTRFCLYFQRVPVGYSRIMEVLSDYADYANYCDILVFIFNFKGFQLGTRELWVLSDYGYLRIIVYYLCEFL